MLLFCALAVLTSPFVALANPNTISDQRVQDPSLTPALGRGYSLQTYDVLSTCLNFQEKTEPTYNYKYDYHEINSEGEMSSDTSASISSSLSYSFVRAAISNSIQKKDKSNKQSKYMVTTMAMERYYSSIDDTTAELTSYAKSIIDRGDLIGFFASCGSGFIRSIRRTAEITAIFEYTSSSENQVKSMASSMELEVFGMKGPTASTSYSSDSTQTNTDTKITIRAFGLGLNLAGADSLVATTLDEYRAAVQFAFSSMQNDDVGIIKGIEVVPWTSNLQFNDAVVFESTEGIDFDAGGLQSIATGGQTNPKTGDMDVYVNDNGAYTDENGAASDTPIKDVSKNSVISGIEVKSITTINAEFITSMERKYGNELRYLSLARQCVGMLKTYKNNNRFKDKVLIDHTKPTFGQPKDATQCDGANAKFFKVSEVATWLTDEELAARAKQTQNFITYFYGPCASAIGKYSRGGRMTKFWWDIPGCDLQACTDDTCQTRQTCDEDKYPKVDFDAVTGKRTVTCTDTAQLASAARTGDATSSTKSGAKDVDQLIDQFCLPQFDEVATDLCNSFPSPAPSSTPPTSPSN